MNATTALPSRFNPWPWSILGFFILLICAIASYIVFATHQNLDLVRKDYYAEELKFQNKIDQLNRTAALGVKIEVAYDATTRCIKFQLPAAHNQPATKAAVHLYRPNDAALDREQALNVTSAGIEPLDAGKLQPGLWKVELDWTVNNLEYTVRQSIVVGQ